MREDRVHRGIDATVVAGAEQVVVAAVVVGAVEAVLRSVNYSRQLYFNDPLARRPSWLSATAPIAAYEQVSDAE